MNEESEILYNSAKEKIDLLPVVRDYNDRAEIYRHAASLMREAGDYPGAADLASEYEQLAAREEQEGREQVYQKELQRMSGQHKDSALYRLARNNLSEIEDYRDVREQIAKCDTVITGMENRERRRSVIVFLVTAVILAAGLFGVAKYERKLYWEQVRQEKLEKKAEKEAAEAAAEAASEAVTEAVSQDAQE